MWFWKSRGLFNLLQKTFAITNLNFAFSNDSVENVENLVFKSSAKDSTSEGAFKT